MLKNSEQLSVIKHKTEETEKEDLEDSRKLEVLKENMEKLEKEVNGTKCERLKVAEHLVGLEQRCFENEELLKRQREIFRNLSIN